MAARLATPSDEGAILDLCRDALHWHWGTGQTLAPRTLNWGKVEAMVRSGLISDSQGVIGIIDDPEGGICGMIGLVVACNWYSDDYELNDWFTYVRPGRRSIRRFNALVEFAKAQAIRLEMPMWLGFRGDSRVAAKARAYSKHAPACGALFRFDPLSPASNP